MYWVWSVWNTKFSYSRNIYFQNSKVLKWLEYFGGITRTSLAKIKWVLVCNGKIWYIFPKRTVNDQQVQSVVPIQKRFSLFDGNGLEWKHSIFVLICFLLWVLEIVVSCKSLPEQRNNSKISFFSFQITNDSEQWFRCLEQWKYLYHTIKG